MASKETFELDVDRDGALRYARETAGVGMMLYREIVGQNCTDANARKVHVHATAVGGKPLVVIDDDGDGFHMDEEGYPDFRGKFKRFFRSDKGSEDAGGKGVGLTSTGQVLRTLEIVSLPKGGKPARCTIDWDKHRGTFEPLDENPFADKRQHGTRVTLKDWRSEIPATFYNARNIWKTLCVHSGHRAAETKTEIEVKDPHRKGEVFIVRAEARKGTDVPGTEDFVIPGYGKTHGKMVLLPANDKERGSIRILHKGQLLVQDITTYVEFAKHPWTDGRFDAYVDVPYIKPSGARNEPLADSAWEATKKALLAFEEKMLKMLADQQRASKSNTFAKSSKEVERVLREAYQSLQFEEDVQWFGGAKKAAVKRRPSSDVEPRERPAPATLSDQDVAKVVLTPATATLPPKTELTVRMEAYDARGAKVDPKHLRIIWNFAKDSKGLECLSDAKEMRDRNATSFRFRAQALESPEPVTSIIMCVAHKHGNPRQLATGKAVITVERSSDDGKGSGAGAPIIKTSSLGSNSTPSRYDAKTNVLVINSDHPNFVRIQNDAAKVTRYELRYACLALARLNAAPGEDLSERFADFNSKVEAFL